MSQPSVGPAHPDHVTCAARIKLGKILVPTDFSEPSGKALEYAMALAANFGAKVTLMHVAEVGSPGYEFGATDFPRMESVLRIAAEKLITDCLHADSIAGIEIMAVRGWPFGGKRAYFEIIETARRLQVDLIVISTHGLSGLDHLLMGSTAERVVRGGPCPVLVVRAKEHEFIQINAAEGQET